MVRSMRGLGIDEIISDTSGRRWLTWLPSTAHSMYGGGGSVARGEARPDSDIDLLMTIPGPRSIFDLVGLWLDM